MEILIILASVIAGIVISRAYTKYRIRSSAAKNDQTATDEKRGTPFKELKKQPLPDGFEYFFVPPLSSVIKTAEAENGGSLNQNQFNAAKNCANAMFIDAQEALDWQDENGGRPNSFSHADWQRWQEEDNAT